MSTPPAVEFRRPPRARPPAPPGGVGGLFREGVWLVAGQFLSAVALLAGVRMLTEAVPPDVFASVSLAVGVVTLGRNLFCFPFFQAALRFYPEAARAGRVGELRGVVFSYLSRSSWVLSALIVVAGLPWCAWRSTTPVVVPLLVGLMLTDVFRTMETDLLNAARRQRAFATVRTVEAWARPAAAVVAVRYFGAGTAVVLLGYLAASASVYAGLFLFRVERVGAGAGSKAAVASGSGAGGGPGADDLAGRVWRFGVPLVPLAVLDWTSLLGDRYLIGGLLGLKAAGVYAAAYGLTLQPFALTQQLVEQLLRPHYFEAVAGGDRAAIRRTFAAWVGVTGAACGAGVVAVTALRVPVTNLLLAEPYRAGAGLLPFFAAGNAMAAMGIVYEKVAQASNRTGLVLAGRSVGAAASLAVGVPMTLAGGVRGAALAVPVYYGLQMLYCRRYARRLDAGLGGPPPAAAPPFSGGGA